MSNKLMLRITLMEFKRYSRIAVWEKAFFVGEESDYKFISFPPNSFSSSELQSLRYRSHILNIEYK